MQSTVALRVPVAVGVIANLSGQILVSRRLSHQSFSGFWEFPGGKIEAGETIEQALARELFEEIGIEVVEQQHWLNIDYNYDEKAVMLHVQKVLSYQGTPWGKEGQEIQWLMPEEILNLNWLPANQGIVKALSSGVL